MSVPLRSCRDHDAEAWVLTEEPGRRLLAEVANVSEPRPADITRWRKLAPPHVVAAAVRLAACRARAKAKFSRGDRMWLDPVGLEQATGESVARHKAGRFACPVVVDLCAGIGGDSVALAQTAKVLAVDSDHGMCRRLAWNAAVYEVADRVLPCRSRAETLTIPPGAWIHIDPDRRASGQERARRLAGYTPGLESLRSFVRLAPGGAIKLSPASDFAAHFSGPQFEVELISLRGECKEATVWFGAAATCRLRATRLPENVTWTDGDGGLRASFRVPVVPVSAFVYDPDPALLRVGLLDSFAAAHGVNRIAADIDYLTGDRLVNTPFLTPFAVQSVHRLDMKQLRRLVAEQELGPVEIKMRGLDLAPETLRTQLRVRGSHPATLILAGGVGPARAILAQRPGTAG
ncbi:MAG: class I SAM-dependent methyltransferase [Isosphaeraceae bacterium]|jgi:hypothetical protein